MKTYSKVMMIISAVLMVVTGIIIICNPGAALVSLAWIIGLLTLIAGITVTVFYFSAARGLLGAGTVLFAGISDIIIGILFLNHGFAGAQVLELIVGIWMTMFGVERFIHSFDMKKLSLENWRATLILGIICTILGIMTLLSPFMGAVLVSVIIGISFIFFGIALCFILHAIEKATNDDIVFTE